MITSERLRIATTLCHAVPGVSLQIKWRDGTISLAAHHRLDANLSPCALRATLGSSLAKDSTYLLESIETIEDPCGLQHLGAGLYRRRRPSTSNVHRPAGTSQFRGGVDRVVEERWFVTLLNEQQTTDIFEECPEGLDSGDVDVTLRPDPLLGTTTVCMSAEVGQTRSMGRISFGQVCLDRVSSWASASLLVGELLLIDEPKRTP